ncbi:DNA polymerase III subunit gamma/tau [bacterium]|nr:DNA polymerase III subunit gamma/tau [bacterium]
MSYVALARKWRPQRFEELIGQEHITTSLKNVILGNRITQAYLFAGPRGTGKTTAARILAKAINCQEKDLNFRPCNNCNFCLEVTKGSSLDVLEIDGASNRGIDEIRELRERIKFAPVSLKYKIYIIDEVHMLTEPAFNALLKTLEEPPSYAIFIFATTDPNKVPLTILSRCQRYDFRRISKEDMIKALERIAQEEGVIVDSSALDLISLKATGSLRDGQTILEQLITYKGEVIKKEDVLSLLGKASYENLINLSQSISCQDITRCLSLIKELYYQGLDLKQLVFDLLQFYKDLYLLKISSHLVEVLELSKNELDPLMEQVKNYSLEYLKNIIECLKKLYSELKGTDHPKLILELGMMDLIELKDKVPISHILSQLKEIEERGKAKELTFSLKKDDSVSLLSELSEHSSLEIIPSLNLEEAQRGWSLLLERLKKKKASLIGFLSQGEIIGINNDTLILGFKESFYSKMIEKKENKEIIEEEIRNVFNQELRLKIVAQKKNEVKKEEADELNYSLLLDREPVVKETLEIFEGQIISIKNK